MLGVIADAPGVLPLVAAGAVGVVADPVQEDVVVIVEGQVIGAVIIGEEAYQRCFFPDDDGTYDLSSSGKKHTSDAAPPSTTVMAAAVSVRLLCFSAVMPMRALSSSSLFSVMVFPAAR